MDYDFTTVYLMCIHFSVHARLCDCLYMYMYVYTHTHTHRPRMDLPPRPRSRGAVEQQSGVPPPSTAAMRTTPLGTAGPQSSKQLPLSSTTPQHMQHGFRYSIALNFLKELYFTNFDRSVKFTSTKPVIDKVCFRNSIDFVILRFCENKLRALFRNLNSLPCDIHVCIYLSPCVPMYMYDKLHYPLFSSSPVPHGMPPGNRPPVRPTRPMYQPPSVRGRFPPTSEFPPGPRPPLPPQSRLPPPRMGGPRPPMGPPGPGYYSGGPPPRRDYHPNDSYNQHQSGPYKSGPNERGSWQGSGAGRKRDGETGQQVGINLKVNYHQFLFMFIFLYTSSLLHGLYPFISISLPLCMSDFY